MTIGSDQAGPIMHMNWEGPVGVVFDAMAECQAILDDNAPDALAKISAVLESPELLRAMYAVGFFPQPNNREAVVQPAAG
jgi:hypothetical protein